MNEIKKNVHPRFSFVFIINRLSKKDWIFFLSYFSIFIIQSISNPINYAFKKMQTPRSLVWSRFHQTLFEKGKLSDSLRSVKNCQSISSTFLHCLGTKLNIKIVTFLPNTVRNLLNLFAITILILFVQKLGGKSC